MTTATPLMPKATAVWLVENTSLSFDQIAEFCHLHPLEVQAIADGEAALSIKGLDPVLTGQLTREEIKRAEADPGVRLGLAQPRVAAATPAVSKRKGPRYTPVSRRQDRPNAILWLVRNHPELKDAAIMRLVGTTKPTIESIRNRTHWNSNNLQPTDPVALGLCSQIDLDFEVEKAARNAPPSAAPVEGATLLPASETTTAAAAAALAAAATRPERSAEKEAADEASAVFAKLKSMKGPVADDEDEK
ncbi:MAG TPA: cell cycle transcriptional regulator TrcR [Bauldia sp.]|nr:cell cycle transcriptional regulator TrcR [Bauldia sp.]